MSFYVGTVSRVASAKSAETAGSSSLLVGQTHSTDISPRLHYVQPPSPLRTLHDTQLHPPSWSMASLIPSFIRSSSEEIPHRLDSKDPAGARLFAESGDSNPHFPTLFI